MFDFLPTRNRIIVRMLSARATIFVEVTLNLTVPQYDDAERPFISHRLLFDSRRFMHFLNNTQFSGASGPVQFAGADRTGIVSIMQFVGNKSQLVGQFSADVRRNASDRMTLQDSSVLWMTKDGLPPSDGTPGMFHRIIYLCCSPVSWAAFRGVQSLDGQVLVIQPLHIWNRHILSQKGSLTWTWTWRTSTIRFSLFWAAS